MALSLTLTWPAFIWSATVSPTLLFILWYDAVYGSVTRLLLGRFFDWLLKIWGIIWQVILFALTNTWEAIEWLYDLLWTQAWNDFFIIVQANWNAFVGIIQLTWNFSF